MSLCATPITNDGEYGSQFERASYNNHLAVFHHMDFFLDLGEVDIFALGEFILLLGSGSEEELHYFCNWLQICSCPGITKEVND